MIAWLKANPEDIARLMQRADRHLAGTQGFGLDRHALDRSSHDWRTMDVIVRDLLRVALWLKSYPRLLHAKVFLREDQFERTVTDFPDTSKVSAIGTNLVWVQHDLHGLLWQLLVNASGEHGECLRALHRRAVKTPLVAPEERWQLAGEIKRETPAQRALLEALAGPWMGRDKRRGVPYVWSVSHLVDGRGRTSPRSSLAAI